MILSDSVVTSLCPLIIMPSDRVNWCFSVGEGDPGNGKPTEEQLNEIIAMQKASVVPFHSYVRTCNDKICNFEPFSRY